MQKSTHQIVESSRILSLLKRLMKEQVPITVFNQESNEEWYGKINEMLFHQGELIIGEIENVGSKDIKLKDRQYQFHSKLTGVAISFESVVLSTEKVSNNTVYRAAYPKAISYHQRRTAERLGLWVDQKIPVNIHLEGNVILKGHIHDISVDGLNACFYRIISIAPNEVLLNCTIQLPSGKTVSSKLEVKGITINENIGQLHVRGKFLDMSPAERKELSIFVEKLELTLGDPDLKGPKS